MWRGVTILAAQPAKFSIDEENSGAVDKKYGTT